MATKPAPLPGAEGLWTRRLWMRCAAVSGCLAMIIWIWGNLSGNDLETRYFRLAAQIQFIHSMTCFGCATFMNLGARKARFAPGRSEEHPSELQSLMRTSYAVFCLKKQTT